MAARHKGTLGRVALSTNDAWNVLNYRAGLIRALQSAGYEVTVLAPDGPHVERLKGLRVASAAVPMEPRGTSPLADLRTLIRFREVLARIKPVAFLGFTSKPNIYGSIAAHSLRVPVINNISGLGRAFGRRTMVVRIVETLYRIALRRSVTIFFQNPDDRALFESLGISPSDRSALLPGSGVDLARFEPAKGAHKPAPFTFLLASRLLWDKGVAEFVEAARRIGTREGQVRFQILGMVEAEGRDAVPLTQLDSWASEGVIEYLGARDDVRGAYAAADCVVLPTYYPEGIPRVLLEAAAMAIPLITTDMPGCREAVDHELTGLLCEPRSVESVMAAMERMLAMPVAERKSMGAAGRAKMERQFDEAIVHRAYIEVLGKVAAPTS